MDTGAGRATSRSLISQLFEAFNGGGTYPIKGIFYFAFHPFLYPLLKARLLPCFLLSTFVLVNLFLWTYLPQVAVLAIFHGIAGAWINGTILVLGEGAAIVALLFEAWFVDEARVDVFDSVLVARGEADLVSASRPVAPEAEGLNPRTRLGSPTGTALYAPFSIRQSVEMVLFLPLNLIPVLGVPLFMIATGYRAGPLMHWRYFKLKGFDRRERTAFVKKRRWMYTWLGTVALALQLIPVLNVPFLLTTAAGSALWASKLEEEHRMEEEANLPPPPPQYTDDPI